MKVKLRATSTFVYEYEADSNNYGENKTIKEMIQIDSESFNDDPLNFAELASIQRSPEIKIEEIK